MEIDTRRTSQRGKTAVVGMRPRPHARRVQCLRLKELMSLPAAS